MQMRLDALAHLNSMYQRKKYVLRSPTIKYMIKENNSNEYINPFMYNSKADEDFMSTAHLRSLPPKHQNKNKNACQYLEHPRQYQHDKPGSIL